MDKKELEKLKVAAFNLEYHLTEYFDLYLEIDKTEALKALSIVLDYVNEIIIKEMFVK